MGSNCPVKTIYSANERDPRTDSSNKIYNYFGGTSKTYSSSGGLNYIQNVEEVNVASRTESAKSIEIKYRNGSSCFVNKDNGNKTYFDKNNNLYKVEYPDGSYKCVNSDGSYEKHFKNNDHVERYSKDNELISRTFSNGEQWNYADDGKTVKSKYLVNGDIITYKNGIQSSKRFVKGGLSGYEVYDKNGNLSYGEYEVKNGKGEILTRYEKSVDSSSGAETTRYRNSAGQITQEDVKYKNGELYQTLYKPNGLIKVKKSSLKSGDIRVDVDGKGSYYTTKTGKFIRFTGDTQRAYNQWFNNTYPKNSYSNSIALGQFLNRSGYDSNLRVK